MKKSFFSLALALSLVLPTVAQANDPFGTPPKNYKGAETSVQINSVAIPEMPAITRETGETHAAATPMPTTTASTGPSTWLALAIGLLLVSLGSVFGIRMSRKS